MKKFSVPKLIGIAVAVVFGLTILFSSFYTIKSTQRGVLSTFGKISETTITDGLFT